MYRFIDINRDPQLDVSFVIDLHVLQVHLVLFIATHICLTPMYRTHVKIGKCFCFRFITATGMCIHM